MSCGLDLPFQWDDGKFISPFVASSDEALAELSTWMFNALLLPFKQQQSSATLRLTDLGCGDGHALLSLCAHLFLRWGTNEDSPNASSLQMSVAGLDLDETLIDLAKQRVPSLLVSPPNHLHCVFEVADVRHCEVEQYFPLDERCSHVLFLYLLPEGLEIIRDKLLQAFRRVQFVVSNRWEVPFLSKWKVAELQRMHVYHYSDEEES
ncbi:uncharacterized protein TM35_000131300 [Trypanosoma theileri]|uniref:Methyltransferase domain-containing protein n=1 Tax=Trypanosoma theileri TaxID=67003 RepID=A0A1X0NWN1_9TRYP|nr:uncharacterized protein TM35_000131300 [Trypanosoma theileri]ORC89126.1 hypothetical protein TM35_000131300 [Trypanosoma theileri]